MILNLDPGFKPFPNETEISFDSFLFAGGEPHIKIHPFQKTNDPVTITHRLNSFADLGLLCLATDALRRMDITVINVFIPYFPGARQDRVMVKGEPLTVKVYAGILNALQLNKIYILDPHSEVTPALLDNCEVIPNYPFISQVCAVINQDIVLISPDGGALKKIHHVSTHLGGIEVIECSKSRDVSTGKLNGFTVYHTDLANKNCLIVDDICDGGGTFIGLAKELKQKNAGKLYLAVTHGIFSKGFDELEACFDLIFTTNSIREIASAKLVQVNIDHTFFDHS